jgi:hypothetical protein
MFLLFIVSVILRKIVYNYVCPIPNDFLDRATSLYSFKTLNKKKILLTGSNTGIYCSSDKVGLVEFFFYKIAQSTLMLFVTTVKL